MSDAAPPMPKPRPRADPGVAAVLGRAARRAGRAPALRRRAITGSTTRARAARGVCPTSSPGPRSTASAPCTRSPSPSKPTAPPVRRRGAPAAGDRRAHRGRAALDDAGRRRPATRSPSACRWSRSSTTATTAHPAALPAPGLTRRRAPTTCLGRRSAHGIPRGPSRTDRQGGIDRGRGRWTRSGRRPRLRPCRHAPRAVRQERGAAGARRSRDVTRRRRRHRSPPSSTCATPTRSRTTFNEGVDALRSARRVGERRRRHVQSRFRRHQLTRLGRGHPGELRVAVAQHAPRGSADAEAG